ncbi:MAG: sulfatase-like hydrolase/transferase [Acidimicrobiales bacterium]
MTNVLFLFSDEHRRDAMGCAGHSLVRTPHLDALADRGTRFTNAMTPSPICVPARAALAAGEYVHATRCWSNAQAYAGNPTSWGHRLQKTGHRVDSIGKLHYRGSRFENGFDRELLPMYIRGEQGWVKGLLRNHELALDCSEYATMVGPSDSTYTDYDLGVTAAACDWLRDSDNTTSDAPWALFVSWLRPHYPLHCPPDLYDLYPLDDLDDPLATADPTTEHPVVQTLRRNFDFDRYFTDETRRMARASYFALCTFLDAQIGRVLAALESSGHAEDTIVIYTSDHGDHNGDRGLWTKMTLFEESAGIPMIVAGPDVPSGMEVGTPTSLVDIRPTILSGMNVADDGRTRPGVALQEIATSPDHDRAVLSEYHDGGSPTGMFSLRTTRWKYNAYAGHEPELYDLDNDPDEQVDLASHPDHVGDRAECEKLLADIVDVERANTLAFSDQADRIEELGGEQAILDAFEFDFTPVGS